VSLSRAIRYTGIALLVEHFGRHLIRVVVHPTQYWGWFLLFAAVIALLVAGGIVFNRRLTAAPAQ